MPYRLSLAVEQDVEPAEGDTIDVAIRASFIPDPSGPWETTKAGYILRQEMRDYMIEVAEAFVDRARVWGRYTDKEIEAMQSVVHALRSTVSHPYLGSARDMLRRVWASSERLDPDTYTIPDSLMIDIGFLLGTLSNGDTSDPQEISAEGHAA